MKKLTFQQSKEKIYHYCAYQERSHLEVRSKLFTYGLSGDDVDEILTSLILEGYLNEERYAKAYAGGKFRMKKWGKLKIIHGLENKGVSKNCIQAGLKEIDRESYKATLRELLVKKSMSIDELNSYIKRDRLSKFAIMRGYEPEEVWQVIRQLFPG